MHFSLFLQCSHFCLELHTTKTFPHNPLNWSCSKDKEGKEHRVGATQFQPTDARRAFPCFDEPQLKAEFKVESSVQDVFKSVSTLIVFWLFYRRSALCTTSRWNLSPTCHQQRPHKLWTVIPLEWVCICFIMPPSSIINCQHLWILSQYYLSSTGMRRDKEWV